MDLMNELVTTVLVEQPLEKEMGLINITIIHFPTNCLLFTILLHIKRVENLICQLQIGQLATVHSITQCTNTIHLTLHTPNVQFHSSLYNAYSVSNTTF